MSVAVSRASASIANAATHIADSLSAAASSVSAAVKDHAESSVERQNESKKDDLVKKENGEDKKDGGGRKDGDEKIDGGGDAEIVEEKISPVSSTNSSMADVREGETEANDKVAGAAADDSAAVEKALVDFVIDDVQKTDAEVGATAAVDPTTIKLEYDLAAAVRRQQMFYYQARDLRKRLLDV